MDTKWSLIVVVAYLLNLVNCELELKITKGKIKGQILKSRDGRPYYSYTGIPYAKPPIGDLRFKVYFRKHYVIFERKKNCNILLKIVRIGTRVSRVMEWNIRRYERIYYLYSNNENGWP